MYLLKGNEYMESREYIECMIERNETDRGKGRKEKRETGHRPKAEECHPIYCITGRLSIQWKLSAFVARRYLDDICAREREREEREEQKEKRDPFYSFIIYLFLHSFKGAELYLGISSDFYRESIKPIKNIYFNTLRNKK